MVEPKRYRVGVAGASGFAGGEFLRLAAQHPNLAVEAVTAHSHAGAVVTDVHPSLQSMAGVRFTATSPEAFAGLDAVVLALPHQTSGEFAALLESQPGSDQQVVIDLGADHRLVDANAWERFYGSPYSGAWDYGLPELIMGRAERANGAVPAQAQRDILRHSRRIAVPGCNVAAVTLGLQPGFADGVLDPGGIVAVLVNGYSGAGRTLKPHLLAAGALGSATPYAVGGVHRHIPEIQQNLAVAAGGYLPPQSLEPYEAGEFRISFTPTLAPMSRGILAVATAPLSAAWQVMLEADSTDGKSQTQRWLREVWESAYANEPFIRVLPEGQWPATGNVAGGNGAQVQVIFDQSAGRVVTVTAIDNLVKGTAGTAIQALNLALGLAETTGLELNGVAP